MPKYKVVLTDNIFPDLDLERSMLASIDAELIEVKNPDQMLNLITDADAVINTYVKMPAHVIEKLQKCKIIVRNGIGVDTIDIKAASEKGIIVANVPSYCIDEVATHATTLILTCHRKIFYLGNKVNAGIWNVKLAAPIIAPEYSTVGLVGFGKIPRQVSNKVQALGFNVIAYDPYVTQQDIDDYKVKMVDIPTLLKESDYISIHCPLTEQTRGMFDYEAFKQMKKTAFIVNTARGAIINEKEMISALQDGLIAGAALDVLEKDGITSDHPLLGMDNVIITPHAAWYSEQSIIRRREQTVEAVISVLNGGEPVSFVNKKMIA